MHERFCFSAYLAKVHFVGEQTGSLSESGVGIWHSDGAQADGARN